MDAALLLIAGNETCPQRRSWLPQLTWAHRHPPELKQSQPDKESAGFGVSREDRWYDTLQADLGRLEWSHLIAVNSCILIDIGA